MTPSLSGRMAWMWLGVRPIIALASAPTARTWLVLVLIATTDGSFSTTPRPRTYASVLAVPRSTAMSRPRKRKAFCKVTTPFERLLTWFKRGRREAQRLVRAVSDGQLGKELLDLAGGRGGRGGRGG